MAGIRANPEAQIPLIAHVEFWQIQYSVRSAARESLQSLPQTSGQEQRDSWFLQPISRYIWNGRMMRGIPSDMSYENSYRTSASLAKLMI